MRAKQTEKDEVWARRLQKLGKFKNQALEREEEQIRVSLTSLETRFANSCEKKES